MKLFILNGKIKPLNKIILIKDDMQIVNPTEEMVLEAGWIEYKVPEPTDAEKLEQAKAMKILEITEYDASSAVNEFSVQGYPIWLDKATRAGLKLRFEAELQSGITETALWYNGVQFPIPVELGIQILLAVELYASACYDNTQKHMANVQALTTMEEIEAYDFTIGYPEKLQF